MKKTLILIFLAIPFFINAQEFELSGNFEGSNTKQVIIQYKSLQGEYISDTLEIVDGKFSAKGNIKGTQLVNVLGNTSSNSMEDPNLGRFFLEPGDIQLNLKEDNFKNLKVINSQTQSEFQKIKTESLKIISVIDSLSKEGADNEKIMEKFEEIKNLELVYAKENPTSILSPYYVQFYMRQLEPETLQEYYAQMSEKNKKSIYGEEIKNLLNTIIVKSDDKAPDFDLIDLRGNSLSMDKFNGKYLLIDFWAGWCIPCVKQLPELKNLSKKFKNKDFEILGVSFDQNKEQWKKSVIKHETQNWNHVYIGMENIRKEGSLSEKYDIQPIPAYILIDKEGRIIDRYLNASDNNNSFKDLTLKLEELMAK